MCVCMYFFVDVNTRVEMLCQTVKAVGQLLIFFLKTTECWKNMLSYLSVFAHLI